MTTPACPYCATEIVDEVNFCIDCLNQVKCIQCSALLYKNKLRCLKCGEPIKDNGTSLGKMNTYSLKEKVTKTKSSRHIEIQASDTAIGALMARFPLDLNAPLRLLNVQETHTEFVQLPPPNNYEELPTIESQNGRASDDEREESDATLLKPERLFTEHSEHGIIPSKTFRDYLQKLPSKRQKQQAFAIMFVWAYSEMLGERVSHEELMAVIKYESLYDSNSSTYLSEVVNDFFKTVDNHYEVNGYDGAQRVNEIIKNIQNPEQLQASTPSRKASKKGGRPPGRESKAELEVIKPWLAIPLDIPNSFDVRKLKSAPKWAAFGLYLLTKILRVQETVEAGVVYAFLAEKYPSMSAKRKNFVAKMRTNDESFSLSAGGAFSLTETGEKEIKKLIEGSGST
jgi:hypothetical protein